jgi:hypothetical protein
MHDLIDSLLPDFANVEHTISCDDLNWKETVEYFAQMESPFLIRHVCRFEDIRFVTALALQHQLFMKYKGGSFFLSPRFSEEIAPFMMNPGLASPRPEAR